MSVSAGIKNSFPTAVFKCQLLMKSGSVYNCHSPSDVCVCVLGLIDIWNSNEL